MTSSKWQSEDAALLKKLRNDKRLDQHAFARMTSISIEQVVQLENGGVTAFHTPILKYQLGRKLLRLLGTDTKEELAKASQLQLADASALSQMISSEDKNFALKTLDKIAAQSKRNLNPSLLSEVKHSLKTFWINHVVVSRVLILLIFLFVMNTFFRLQVKQFGQYLWA
jgi:transcriptional regulator with XRE-family HTH domain